MANKRQAMQESLQLRNAARRLLRADMRALKGDDDEAGLGEMVSLKASVKANSLLNDAKRIARDNPVKIGAGLALGLGVCVSWMFRDRIVEAAKRLTIADDLAFEIDEEADEEPDEEAEPDAVSRRSHSSRLFSRN